MMMVKSLNHTPPSVPGERFFSLQLIFHQHSFRKSVHVNNSLDYPGVGPELSFLKDVSIQRFRWRSLKRYSTYFGTSFFVVSLTCNENLHLISVCSVQECLDWRGYIIPALGTSHALAHLEKLCPTLADGTRMVLIFGGRGDKDVQTAIILKFKEKITFIFRQ